MQGFYPAEEFLECSEMGYCRENKEFLDSFHVSNIFDEFPVVLVPVILEENKDKQLMLGRGFLRVFAGIRIEMGRFYNRKSCLDKPDIPACRSLYCLLT